MRRGREDAMRRGRDGLASSRPRLIASSPRRSEESRSGPFASLRVTALLMPYCVVSSVAFSIATGFADGGDNKQRAGDADQVVGASAA